MRIVLYGAVGVIALLLVLLLVPVHLYVVWDGGLRVRLRYLFYRKVLYPAKEDTSSDKKASPSGKDSPWKRAERRIRDEGIEEALDYYIAAARAAGETLQRILRALKVDRLRLEVTVAGDDAASTALAYGGACAVIYTAVGLLATAVPIRSQYVTVTPDFTGGQERLSGELRLHGQPLRMAWAVLRFIHAYSALENTAYGSDGAGHTKTAQTQ